MNPERWSQIEGLFHAALEREPEARQSFLEKACGDLDLRREVESLLERDGATFEGLLDSTLTQLAAGAQLGPYKIEAPIGAGGMGQVFKALDTRLGRTVAIKISKEQFSERFEREARAVAALNHPSICTLHDVGPNYLVMEFVEGEPLKGPLPLEKSVEYAGQILEALDAAHRKGITHRDLKPANILVTKQGIKLLDFGVAKHRSPVGEADTTLTPSLTRTGEVVGTLPYMSPEQLQGKEIDGRSDLFSFGCVLYEMLSGKRAFEAPSAASLMVAILEREPPSLEATPALDRLVRRSLAKDPDQRFQTARDLKAALAWAMEQPPASTVAKEKSGARWKIAAGVLAAAALAVSLWALFLHFRAAQPPERVLRYTVAAPDNSTVQSFAVSPDGRYVTIAAAVNGRRQLWLRALDALQAQPMPGTDDATYPFWSPDSHHIGFFAQGKLKRVAASGGPAQSLCNATNGRGGSWSRDDVIVFSPDSSGVVIQRVPAGGGVPSDVTKTKSSRFPIFLPDGHHFLYTEVGASRENNGVYLSSLDGNENRRVLPDTSSVVFGAGHLLFFRENTLMAQPFDPNRAQISGDVFPVAEGVSLTANIYFAPVTVSENGMLLYASGASVGSSQIVWFDRGGKLVGSLGTPGVVWEPSISPDEKVVAFRSSTDSTADIWLRDLAQETDTRFTSGASASLVPSWSPKGDRIVFGSNQAGTYDLYQKAASGSGPDQLLHSTAHLKVPYQWSPDGRFIVYSESDPKTKFDLWVLPVGGDGAGVAPPSGPGKPKPIRFLQTEFNELYGQLSPDGRWMAYTSDESGRREVYVRPFPPAEGMWRISAAGGEQPRWRGDGKELFFVGLDGKMTAVVVKAMAGPRPSFERAALVPLFETHIGEGSGHVAFQYDVTADGKRFVVATNVVTALPHLTVVVNWIAGFKR